MMLRAIELMLAWYRGVITDAEFLNELRKTLNQAAPKWNLDQEESHA